MAVGGRGKRFNALRKIPAIAAADHRNTLAANGNKTALAHLSRKDRRIVDKHAKRLVKQYNEVLRRLKESGAGFPVDKILRELCFEYTHRYAASGIYNQPLNFNYFETFCEIRLHKDSVAPFAEPAEEIDHLFSLTDFFDYATSEESNQFRLSDLLELPENKVFHYTINGKIDDFTFLTPRDREFVISGFSLIRHGNYLSWYIVGGEIFSPQDWQNASHEFSEHTPDAELSPPWKRRFLKEAAERIGGKAGNPVRLEGTKTAQRTIIVGEIDLRTEKHLGRCYMSEWDNLFDLIPDDVELLRSMAKGSDEELEGIIRAKIGGAEVMWGLGQAMFQLPSYFAFKILVSKPVAVSGGARLPPTKKGGQGLGATFRNVTAIDFIAGGAVPIRSLSLRHYHTETTGYWRRGDPASFGSGVHGEPVRGRTWIKSEKKLKVTNDQKPIYVKSTIASAKALAEQFEQRALQASLRQDGQSTAPKNVLYVLRCAVMQDEVFKVGWTSGTAEERAKQISSATGVPNSFIVVGQWKHSNPEALEKNVHAMLDPYRISDNREFFKLDYVSLNNIIELEIARVRKT